MVVSDIDDHGGCATVREIEEAGGQAQFRHADVGVEDEIRELIAFAEKTYGGLDVMVNSAGPYFHAAALDHWFDTLQSNLLGTMYGTRFAIDAMRRRGGGAIVNFGSTSAVGHGHKHSSSPAYDAAKAGIMRLTTTLAGLREKENIRVNCIVPDWVATDEVQSYVDSLKPEERAPNGVPEVLTTLDEIADAALRLATDESLAGRVMVWWSGKSAGLIPVGDLGYGKLE